MSCCGEATLHGRRVWIVELNASELRRATDYADWMQTQERGVVADDVQRGRPARWEWNELGAQGALVVAKIFGVRAPLPRGRGRALIDAPVPPCWNPKTQLSSSRDTLDRYMRIMASAFHPGWRHVYVERDVGLWGGFVFVVHGWIADERARDVSVQRYSYSSNRFVHMRHLTPLTRELYDTAHGAPTDEPPAPAPFDADPDAQASLLDGDGS